MQHDTGHGIPNKAEMVKCRFRFRTENESNGKRQTTKQNEECIIMSLFSIYYARIKTAVLLVPPYIPIPAPTLLDNNKEYYETRLRAFLINTLIR